MLKFLCSLRSLSLLAIPLACLAALDFNTQPNAETMMASRYHQRAHSATAAGRGSFRSNRSQNVNQYRQHFDRVSPSGPHMNRPQQMIATKPAAGVQS